MLSTRASGVSDEKVGQNKLQASGWLFCIEARMSMARV